MIERLLVKMGANQEKMDIRMADLKAQIGCLTSHIDVNQEKLGAYHREMKARQEKTEAAVHSIRSELLETVIHQVENSLACVNQRTQGLGKELNEKIDETQVDLQLVMTSIDTSTRRLKGEVTDTKDCHEVLANTRKDLHEELGLMLQVEAQKTKALTEPTRHEFQTQLTKVEALTEYRKGTGTGGGAEKPPKFDDTTSWAVFWRQFDTVAEHNCWTRLEKSTYLITALQIRDAYVLHGISKGATYEETLEALEDCFGDQYLAGAYPGQLKCDGPGCRRIPAIICHSRRTADPSAYLALPEDHIGREAGKSFADGAQEPAIKIQLLPGGKKTVNEYLRQAVLLATRHEKPRARTFWGSRPPPTGRRGKRQSA
jgi:hypothetical protein